MKTQVLMLGQLIEKTINDSAYDLEASVKADILLMGSFQYSTEASDIDLVFIYRISNYENIRRLKKVLSEVIWESFKIPVHYTTLSKNEYGQMIELRQEKSCVLYEYSFTKECAPNMIDSNKLLP